MSDPASPRQSRAFLAPIYLAVLFAGGLLLAYSATPPQSPSTAGGGATPETAASPQPPAPGGVVADAGDTRLVEARQRILELEQAIDALKATQASALDEARVRAAQQVASQERRQREALEKAEQLNRAYSALGACLSERGARVTLAEADLPFAPGQAALPNSPPKALDRLAEILQRNPGLLARVEGHTDSQGKAGKNLALSNQRAEAVRQALLSRGIDPGRVQAEGMGEANPVDTNATESGRSRNRRVEILLTLSDGHSPEGSGSASP